MGENSCRSDCLSLRNKCCTLSFTPLLPSALLCLSFLLPLLLFFFDLALSPLASTLPVISPPLLMSLFTTCQFILPFLTLSAFFPVLSSSPPLFVLFSPHPLLLSPVSSSLSPHLTTTFLPSRLIFLIIFFLVSSDF